MKNIFFRRSEKKNDPYARGEKKVTFFAASLRQYESSKTDDIPAMDALMAWLPHNIPNQVHTEKERVCVCERKYVCVCERERVYVCVREYVSVCERERG